jgi:small GTP-binding protein
MNTLSKKVILLGHFGVGKTSLIKRYVHQKFSEEYLTTIGVKIDKKVVNINGREISMLIWDIAGENTQQKVPSSYKLGAHGVIFVFDLTRPSSYENLEEDIVHMQNILPPIPFVLVGNKTDIIDDDQLVTIKDSLPVYKYFFSSAKTGDHVEELFEELGKLMIQ